MMRKWEIQDARRIAGGLLIGLVWALAVPRAGATPDPKSVAALDEMQTLAGALELCAAETGYYVSLETLDDDIYPDSQIPYNYLNQSGGTWVIYPPEGRFRPQRVDFVNGPIAWGGPYVVYQPGKIQTGLTPYDRGSPLDPWGNPYCFYSPLGLVRGDTGQITLELHGDVFDRYTLASLGPDGVVSGDDIIYQFGGGVTGLILTSARALLPSGGAGITAVKMTAAAIKRVNTPLTINQAGLTTTGTQAFTVPAGARIALRGKNLGATQGDAIVYFEAQPLNAITAWSASEVQLTLPATLSGTGALTLRRGTTTSNPLTLRITPTINAARAWTTYR